MHLICYFLSLLEHKLSEGWYVHLGFAIFLMARIVYGLLEAHNKYFLN